jgi:ferredoxin
MQIRILRNECCGHGDCVTIAPGVFALDARNRSTVVDPEGDAAEKVMEAAENCPCTAIQVLDDDGEVVFP